MKMPSGLLIASILLTPALGAAESRSGARLPLAESLARLWLSGPCEATEVCDDGSTISCQGQSAGSTCSAGNEQVTCDGSTTRCPCSASVSCPGGETISCSAGPGWFVQCSAGQYWVECNEQVTQCAPACTASVSCGEYVESCSGYKSCTQGNDKWGVPYVECDGGRRSCSDL